jgi:SAM-dependent methyltransferase
MRPTGDVCGDCDKGLCFKAGAFDAILASHILEHIHDLRALKKELIRVLKPGGDLCVIVPYYRSPDAWGDDTHCRAFSKQSFFGDFWPGFRLEKLATQDRVKKANNEKVTWIIAHLKKEDK